MEKMTPECSAVVKLLGDLIDNEVAKPDGEADMDFVMECDALLSDILDEKFSLTDEEIDSRLAKLKIKTTEEKPKKLPNLGRIGRRIAVYAAAVMVAFLGAYSSVPSIQDWVRENLNPGTDDSGENIHAKSDFLEITSITYHSNETESPKITIEFANPTLVYSVDLNGGHIESGEENISSDEESKAITKRLNSYFTTCWKMLWDNRDTLSIK